MHDERMPRPSAVLFDLDCTLTDRPATVAAFAAAFVRHFGDALRFDVASDSPATGTPPASPTAQVAAAVTAVDGHGHRPRAEVFAHLGRALPWARPPGAGALATFWSEAFPPATRPAAGLLETLEGLRGMGVRLGVVTNGGARAQRRKLDGIGVRHLLSAVVISGAVGVRKPDPRIFALALAGVGATAAETWFVGDHPVADVLGARAAGLTPVWRRGVHPWPTEHAAPACQIDRLTDLLRLVH
jgi:putative hydrolase of the HAD superfamily